jgi:hypothetical protein
MTLSSMTFSSITQMNNILHYDTRHQAFSRMTEHYDTQQNDIQHYDIQQNKLFTLKAERK